LINFLLKKRDLGVANTLYYVHFALLICLRLSTDEELLVMVHHSLAKDLHSIGHPKLGACTSLPQPSTLRFDLSR
jgi:hypothetical protein